MEGRNLSNNQAIDLSALLRDAPRNCWLALSDDETRIIGRGETIAEAMEEATKAGVDDPVIMWSPKNWIPAVLRGEL
jgi:alkanesulfonate monooxygenase SsuD/methylene tetrahydromethanopterin reductase-like flavin-dependent oxidoreductase (luciferase family)